MKVFAALAVALPLAYAKKVSYDGYKAFEIESEGNNDGVYEALADLKYVSLACEGHPEHVEVAIAPDSLEAFENLGFNYTVTTEDVGAEIAKEGPFVPYESTYKAKGLMAAVPPISYFNSYHTLAEHNQFLVDLQASFPSNSRLFTVGNSVQGRPIQGIQLWGAARGKRAVVWHGTVHAREWLTAPTVEYLAYQLVLGYQNADTLVRSTLDNYDFFVIPVVNPDGFVYTTTNDRLWRKNRQTRSGTTCVGTDVNRNWPYQWSVPGGSSTSPCAETYRGAAAGDAPENVALRNHISSLTGGPGVKWYVDWHSFSQLILLPYGYSCSARAPNHSTQMTLAAGVAGAIRGVNGLSFTYGPTCSTIYQVSGGSLDWAQAVAGVELSWSYELRPGSSSGSGGFTVPASNILPSGREHWAGVRWLFANW